MSLPISTGSGATVATDLISGAHYGFNKIVDGTPGSTNAWVVDSIGSGQIAVKGNLTLSDSKSFIGLATVVPTYISGYTSLATVISATGLTTLVVPPSGQKVFLRDIHVSSLGRSEFSVWASSSAASANKIPWTSLSTTGGYYDFFGNDGIQMGEANFGLNVALNGGATVGVMVDVRFQ